MSQATQSRVLYPPSQTPSSITFAPEPAITSHESATRQSMGEGK